MKKTVLVMLACLLAHAGLPSALAQTGLEACTKIVNDSERLACFDRVAGTPKFAINPSMAPTCYISQTSVPACGPEKACDPSATGIKAIEKVPNATFSCYVMDATPNCCNYCPPEFSHSC
ncbi:MAG: hypothetical protein AAF431_05255 [Pseudomonadota bacterium]